MLKAPCWPMAHSCSPPVAPYPDVDALFDATNLTWTGTGAPNADRLYQDEQGYTLLPNGNILTVDIWTGASDLKFLRRPESHQRRAIQSYDRHLEQCRQYGGFARRSLCLRPVTKSARLRYGRMEPWSNSAATRAALVTRIHWDLRLDHWRLERRPQRTRGVRIQRDHSMRPRGCSGGGLAERQHPVCGETYAGLDETPTHFFEFTTLNAINQAATLCWY